jgi:anion-transporting  ArsA/GET3 family ATPase
MDFCADFQVPECMNDIINQVETREWNRVNEHRDRLVKKMKKEKTKVKEMKDDWEVATEKIAQENSDLHNEIKKLKNEMKLLKDENEKHRVWCLSDEMIERTSAETIEEFEMDVEDNWVEMKLLKKENEKLQNRIEDAEQRGFDEGRDQYQVDSEYLDEKEDEIKRLRELIEKRDQEIKAVKEANVMFMKRYEKKVEEEKKIDEVCSRIQCEDTFGHLIGRIPTDK